MDVPAELQHRAGDRTGPDAVLSSNFHNTTPGIAATVGFRAADCTMPTGGVGTWRHAMGLDFVTEASLGANTPRNRAFPQVDVLH